jgi:hypothetical protein
MRRAVQLDISPHFYFGSDSLAVRITARVGVRLPHQRAIVKVTAAGS